MDKLDLAILRALTAEGPPMTILRPRGRSSFRAIARRLSVSEGTIRNRIRRMVESGFLVGSRVVVNPGLLGLSVGAYCADVRTGESKAEVVERLSLLEGVVGLQDFHGNHVAVVFVYLGEHALRRRLALFGGIAGTRDGSFFHVPFPRCDRLPSRRDWKLMASLAGTDIRSCPEFAGEQSARARTVKRRFARLLDEGVLFAALHLDYRRITPGIPAVLIARFNDSHARSGVEYQIGRTINDHWFSSGRWDGVTVYQMVVPTPQAATRIERVVSGIEGVSRARVELVDEHIDRVEILTDDLFGRSGEIGRSGSYAAVGRMPPDRGPSSTVVSEVIVSGDRRERDGVPSLVPPVLPVDPRASVIRPWGPGPMRPRDTSAPPLRGRSRRNLLGL